MPRWTSTYALKCRLGITATTWDGVISSILDGVESIIGNMIASPVLQDVTARTEYYDGVVGRELKLRWRPIIKTGLRVWIDEGGFYGDGSGTPFDTGTEWTLGQDFDAPEVWNGYSVSGRLVSLGGIWPARWLRPPARLASELVGERGAVKVTYKAGWASQDIPSALIQAAYLEATTLFNLGVSRNGDVMTGMIKTSESLNGYSYSLGQLGGMDVSGYGASRLSNPSAIAMVGGLGLIDPVFA